MKEKKHIKYLLIALVISISITVLCEVFFNRKVLTKNEFYQADIIETNGIKKDGSWYETTSDEAYVIVKLKDTYINKLYYKYKTENDFNWESEIEEEIIGHNATPLINKVTRKIDRTTDSLELKINFNKKDVKFKDISIDNQIYINWSRVVVVFATLMGLAIIIRYRKYFLEHLDKAFLFIALLSGIIMINITPKTVYYSWDDQIHFRRANTFLSSETATVPSTMTTVINKNTRQSGYFQTQEEQQAYYDTLNKMQKEDGWEEYDVNNYSAKYNNIVYLPFQIGFRISEILNLNYTTSVVLAKLLNFICYTLLMFFAIKVSTKLKRVVFVISVFASNIFLASQFSYDPTIIGSMILATSLFFRMLEDKKLNKKYLFTFIACVIWASLPKAIYSPMLLLLLFIPNKKFDNKKQAILFKSITIIILLLLLSTFVLPALSGSLSGDPRGGDTSVNGQLKFILSNPINYAKIVIKYLLNSGPELVLGEWTIICLAYMNINVEMINSLIYIVNLILLMYCLFKENISKDIINNKLKTVFAIIYGGIMLLIITALYLSFTPVGSNSIEGVQVRYFIPMLLLGLLILIPTSKKIIKEEKNTNTWILIIPFISIMLTNFFIVYNGIGI